MDSKGASNIGSRMGCARWACWRPNSKSQFLCHGTKAVSQLVEFVVSETPRDPGIDGDVRSRFCRFWRVHYSESYKVVTSIGTLTLR
jgi:hypothetical protein